MEKNKLLSIVFPVMNQEDHIERVIKAYHKEISKLGIPFELIAVVNGSTDRSYEICQKVASKLPSVSAYELKEGGFGRGILYGLRKAKGSYLCYTNCARVYPDELSLCIKYYLVNSDVIIHAVRVKRDVWIRKLSSFIYNLTCRLLTGVNSTDINGTPKIMSRDFYEKAKLKFTDSMIDLELLDKAGKFKVPVIEIPIFKNVRHGGKSTSSYKTIFRLMKEMARYRLNRKQLTYNV